MRAPHSILLTGATGLLGRDVLARLLAADARARVFVLVRDAERWGQGAGHLVDVERITPVVGDLRTSGLGLDVWARQQLRRSVTGIVHLAADTTFSRPLADARAVNTEGTRRVLELAAECASPVRVAYVSTAFVAGRRAGVIGESDGEHTAGWANAYEQSKYEAEALVRAHAADWVILRSSTIVCDDVHGRVTQLNAVHRALQLYRNGLAAMMPGVAGSTIDAVTTSYVGRAVADLAFRDDSRAGPCISAPAPARYRSGSCSTSRGNVGRRTPRGAGAEFRGPRSPTCRRTRSSSGPSSRSEIRRSSA